MLNWIDIVIPTITAAGGVWFGKYVNWKYTKMQLKYDERKALIKATREAIFDKNFGQYDFIDTVIYSQLRPYISNELKNNLETYFKDGPPKRSIVEGENYRNSIIHLVFDDLSSLERKWGLL